MAVKHHDKPYEVARRFTNDVPTLASLLQTSLRHLSGHRALRTRVERLAANLNRAATHLETLGGDELDKSHSISLESLVD